MDLKKTNYFDPRKMAARKRWTVQETGQGLIAMTGYAYLGDEEKTALFSGADLEARIRQASAEKPRETELYLRLSNWLVIRRRETLQLKSHAMQVLQLIWRGLFVDMAQQVIAASELKDERLSARRQAVAESFSLTLDELLRWMIITSDNTATNALIRRLTMERVNAFCQEQGWGSTRLERCMLDYAAIDAGRNNYTSARDQCAMFRGIYREEVLSPGMCGHAMEILLAQRCKDDFFRYIPHKIGVYIRAVIFHTKFIVHTKHLRHSAFPNMIEDFFNIIFRNLLLPCLQCFQ